MRNFKLFLLLSLTSISCNKVESLMPIYIIPSDTVDLLEEKYMELEERIKNRKIDKVPVFISSIELKKLLSLDGKINLFFDKKEIKFIEGKNLISKHDIPKVVKGKEIEIKLRIFDFEYNCIVPSYAFEDVRFLSFNLNFSNQENICNETYYGNNHMETLYRISGKYSVNGKIKNRCPLKYIQTLEIVKEYGLGSNNEDWFDYLTTFEGSYNMFNGRFESKLNSQEDIYFELKDSSKLTLSVYENEELRKYAEGEWIYITDYNIISIYFKESIKMVQGNDTISLKDFAFKINEQGSLSLGLMSYRIKENTIEPFELLHLKKK